jgi:type IV secretion system protein VirD4
VIPYLSYPEANPMRGTSRAIFLRRLLMVGMGGLSVGLILLVILFPTAGLLMAGIAALGRFKGWRGSGWAHGTARLASEMDLFEGGLLDEDGLILGRAGYTAPPTRPQALRALFRAPRERSEAACRLFLATFLGRKWSSPSLIRLRRFVHVVTFAATGRGKGVSVLVPNLLAYQGSCVVTDPKGELFKLTAGHREHWFGHRIICLDPFGICGAWSDTFNPLDLMDPNSPTLLDECRDLANMLVVRAGTEHEPHWNDSAELILTAFIAYVCVCESSPHERNLQLVRDLVSSREKFARAVAAMQQSDACGGLMKRLGNLMSWFVDKELGSVLTTVQRHTIFLDTPTVAASTVASSFDAAAIRRQPTTVYLVLPGEQLETLAPLLRMWIGCLLRAVTRGGADERDPVLFLLDEAGHLGRVKALENAVSLARGYGVRLWFIFQSMGQLTRCFGDAATDFLNNIDTQQYFGVNTVQTAEEISKRIGDATVLVESLNRTTSRSRPSGPGGHGHESGQVSTSTSVTTSEVARRLVKAEEVIRLPDDLALVFHRNLPPIPCRLVRYYADPEFRGHRAGQATRLGLRGAVAGLGVLAAGAVILIASLLALATAGGPSADPSVGLQSSRPLGSTQYPVPPLPAPPLGPAAPGGMTAPGAFWRADVPTSPAQ